MNLYIKYIIALIEMNHLVLKKVFCKEEVEFICKKTAAVITLQLFFICYAAD